MVDIVGSLIKDWKFLLALVLFIGVMTALFYKHDGIKIKRVKKSRKIVSKKQVEIKVPEDEPGKLYVPDSTYDILKKEGLMHSREK